MADTTGEAATNNELQHAPEQIKMLQIGLAEDRKRIYALEQIGLAEDRKRICALEELCLTTGEISNFEFITSIIKCLLASLAGALLFYGGSGSAFQVTPEPINPVIYVFFVYVFADAVFTVARVMAKLTRGE